MTILPWIAFAGMGAGAFYAGWNADLWEPLRWEYSFAVPLMVCGAFGIAIGLAGTFAKLLIM